MATGKVHNKAEAVSDRNFPAERRSFSASTHRHATRGVGPHRVHCTLIMYIRGGGGNKRMYIMGVEVISDLHPPKCTFFHPLKMYAYVT